MERAYERNSKSIYGEKEKHVPTLKLDAEVIPLSSNGEVCYYDQYQNLWTRKFLVSPGLKQGMTGIQKIQRLSETMVSYSTTTSSQRKKLLSHNP